MEMGSQPLVCYRCGDAHSSLKDCVTPWLRSAWRCCVGNEVLPLTLGFRDPCELLSPPSLSPHHFLPYSSHSALLSSLGVLKASLPQGLCTFHSLPQFHNSPCSLPDQCSFTLYLSCSLTYLSLLKLCLTHSRCLVICY